MSPRYTDSKSVLQLLSWLRFGFGELRQVPLQENERRAEGGTSIINSLPWVLGLELNLISPADKEYRWPTCHWAQRYRERRGRKESWWLPWWTGGLPLFFSPVFTHEGWLDGSWALCFLILCPSVLSFGVCVWGTVWKGIPHLAVLGFNFAPMQLTQWPSVG